MFRGIFEPMHLVVLAVIVLIIFGPGKLPELGAGLGKSIKEFKKALSGKDENTPELKAEGKEQEKKG